MHRFKWVFPALTILVISASAFGQTPSPFNLKNIIPTSPEAALLGRFGDIPIGYYTGTANIAIPLYTIKEANIEIPIVLRYHGSGIKVEDQASNVGLGWSMEPGGAIIQIVNGRNDQYGSLNTSDPTAYAWLKGSIATGVYNQRPASRWECTDINMMTAGYTQPLFSSLLLGDGEPDIYSYNFPGGYSGKFFINPDNGNIIQLDKKEDIKFEKTTGGWMATTLDGHTFYFLAQETAWSGSSNSFTSKLTKIKFSTGKEINFEYSDGEYFSAYYSERIHSGFPFVFDPGGTIVNGSIAATNHTTKTLSKISTDDLEIEFTLGDRLDIETKKIDTIAIKNKLTQQVLKKFRFSYDYFPYTTFGGAYNYTYGVTTPAQEEKLGKRLKLLSIQEVGYTSTGTPLENPAYEFEYDNTVLPLKTSYSRDYWGYYNGKNNTTLVPDLSFYYYSGYADYQGMPANFLNAGWANRATDKTKLTAGILKKIKYPTGGATEFTYEPHIFSNYDYPDLDKIASAERFITVKDQNNTTDPYTTSFTLPRTETIRFTVSIQRGPGTSVTFNDLLPSTVTLTKVTGIGTPGVTSTILKTWQMINNIDYQNAFNSNGQYQWIEDIQLPYVNGAVYYVTASMPNSIPPQNTAMNQAGVMAQFRYYDLPANGFTTTEGGGIRIAGITNYTANGSVATKKIFKYVKEDQTTSGLLISPLQFLYSRINFFAKGFSMGPGSCPEVLGLDTLIWYLSSESSIPYSNGAGGNPIGYSRVEEIEVTETGISKGKQIYYYHNVESDNHPNVPENPDLQNGLVEKEEVLNEAGSLLSESVYTYENIGFSYFNSVKAIPVFFGHKPCDIAAMFDVQSGCYSIYPLMDEYNILFYPVNSKWFVPKSKQTKQFDGVTPLIVYEVYEYNAKGQRVKSEVYNSKQQKQTTLNTYPADLSPAPGPYTPEGVLIALNRHNTLLEQKTLLDNNEVMKTKYEYQLIPSMSGVYPLSMKRSQYGGTLYEQVKFTSFGDYEKVQQYIERDKPIGVIWSDQYTYPVAQITNIAELISSHAAYTSFEANQTVNKGNWLYSGSPVVETGSPTGKQAYILNGSNNITKTGLSVGTTYIISYWTKNPSAFTIAGTIPGFPVQGKQVGNWRYFEHKITGQTSISISGNGFIDELRLYPLGGEMTSFNYEPFIGITSMSDVNNRITYYEYDAFGRLALIRDQDKNIIRKLCYNYSGQVEICP